MNRLVKSRLTIFGRELYSAGGLKRGSFGSYICEPLGPVHPITFCLLASISAYHISVALWSEFVVNRLLARVCALTVV